MFRKKGLVLVIAMLAIASMMAAMAYTSASVTNTSELKVVNTNQALLSLDPNPEWSWTQTKGLKDKTATIKDGELFIQLGKGVGRDGSTSVFYGLQPNSTYEWNPIFNLRNKSAETIKVTVSATGDYAQYITFGTTVGWSKSVTWGTKGDAYVVGDVVPEINSGMQNIRNIALKIDIPTGHKVSEAEILGSIIVDAQAQ